MKVLRALAWGFTFVLLVFATSLLLFVEDIPASMAVGASLPVSIAVVVGCGLFLSLVFYEFDE